jgi:hypothetical protein
MDFILATIGLLVVGFLILIGLARAFESHSVADFLDWKPTRSPAVEAQNEIDDVQQMIAAQNEYRRKRGAKEITEADAQRQAREDQAIRARGRGPFAEGGGLEDELDAPAPRPRSGSTSKRGAAAKRGSSAKRAATAKKKPSAKKKPASKR